VGFGRVFVARGRVWRRGRSPSCKRLPRETKNLAKTHFPRYEYFLPSLFPTQGLEKGFSIPRAGKGLFQTCPCKKPCPSAQKVIWKKEKPCPEGGNNDGKKINDLFLCDSNRVVGAKIRKTGQFFLHRGFFAANPNTPGAPLVGDCVVKTNKNNPPQPSGSTRGGDGSFQDSLHHDTHSRRKSVWIR
jgi:hypothetical protein